MKAETEWENYMAIARYPRFGQLLAPVTLRPVLDVPVPRHLVKRFARLKLKEVRLADLDATSWERFGEQACEFLAEAIIKQVKQAITLSFTAFRRQRLPRVNRAMPIDDLPLETRTRNCLYRAHLNEDARRLGDLTIGDLLSLWSFGAKCLVDLLCSLETVPHVPGSPLPLTEWPTKLLAPPPLSWIEWARADYPYLPSNTREWTFPALPPTLTWEQLDINRRTYRCLRRSRFGKNPSALSGSPITRLLQLPSFGVGCLRSLLLGLDAVLHPLPQPPAPDLETELLNTFLPNYKKDVRVDPDRNRRIFLRLYGLDGQGGATLEALGDAEGISRERVRQICQLQPRPGHSTPRLLSLLQTVAELLPAPAAHIEAELARRGLVSQHLPLISLALFARALRHQVPFKFIYFDKLSWAVRLNEHEKLFPCLARAARQSIRHCGAASIASIAAQAADWAKVPVAPTLVRSVLGALPDFCWLDEATGWFWLRSYPSNPLLFYVRKILAAAGRLTVNELCDAIRRLRSCRLPEKRFDLLPPRVLNNFCRGMPGFRLEGDAIVADPPLDWRVVLQGVERKIVGIFHKHGPLLHLKDLKKYARARGISRDALWMALGRMPAIRRCGNTLYSLGGSHSTG